MPDANAAVDAMTREIVRRVADVLPAVAQRVVDQMLGEIPFYRAGGAGDEQTVLERVSVNVAAAIDALGSRRHDPTMAAMTGRLRAQQEAPLADVLSAYRIAFGELWDELVRASHIPPTVPAEALVDLSSAVFWLHNKESDALVHAFRDETHLILLTRERERAALIDVLLSDDAGPGTMLEVATSLRLPMDGTFLVATGYSELGRDPMPRISSALDAVDIKSVWRLHRDVTIGVLSLPDPTHDETALAVLKRQASTPIGVSPLFPRISRAPWGLKLARLALGRTSRDADVQQFENNPLNVLLAASPDTSLETARVVLGGILELREDQRDLLLDTIEAWVGAGGSADDTAEALYCHPNTIRKRLKRIEQATDRSLTRPGDISELVAATRAWTQLHPIR